MYANTIDTQNKLNDRSILAGADNRNSHRRRGAVPDADALITMANVILYRLSVSRRIHRTVDHHRTSIEHRISNIEFCSGTGTLPCQERGALRHRGRLRHRERSAREKLSDSQRPERRLRSAPAHKREKDVRQRCDNPMCDRDVRQIRDKNMCD